jgi:hypothetical protein
VSRFEGLPADYDPWLVLSVREAPEGGDLSLEVKCDPPYPPSAARELVVLVHGFNNHMGEAAEAYQGFRDRQYPLAGAVPPALESSLGDFFWPGDADWFGWLDKVDFLVYPKAVHTAPQAGQKLARFIASLPNLLVLHFVGHSLGCRVVLECIKELSTGNHAQIRHVVLMAAAVPDFMVVTGAALADAIAVAQSVLVLHSTSDLVLHYAFPPGQTIAGTGEGVLPVALGRFGPPAGMTGRVEGQRIANAGHGDYWGTKGDDVSAMSDSVRDVVAGYVAASLQLGKLARQTAAARRPGSMTLVGYARKAAGVRTLLSRSAGG